MKEANIAVMESNPSMARKKRSGHSLLSLKRNKLLYLMILPGFVYFVIFKYLPMGGLVISFQDYQPYLGIEEARGSDLSILSACSRSQPSLCCSGIH